jgi:signal transduction histidine kinase
MPVDARRAHGIVRASPLFAGVAQEIADAAIAHVELLSFAPGEKVLLESTDEDCDEASSLYVLIEGQLAASRAMQGHRSERLSTMAPGDFFGELARVEEGTRSATVTAVTSATVARLRGPVVDKLIAEAPIVMRTIAAAIARRLRAADEARVNARLNEERLSLVGKAAAMLAHDLKDPIGRVLNAAECIDEGIGERSMWTAQSRRAAEFMLAMVRDLMAYAKGERSYARDPMRVREVIDDVESYGLRPLEASGKIEVRRAGQVDGTLIGDRRALVRALLNIVRNAGEEMMKTGGTLTFGAELGESTLRFIIRDTGRGIPDAILPTLFEPFATHGKASGTGLGMAMAKAAVDAHQGAIHVNTRAGEGTEFTVELPLPPGRVAS